MCQGVMVKKEGGTPVHCIQEESMPRLESKDKSGRTRRGGKRRILTGGGTRGGHQT